MLLHTGSSLSNYPDYGQYADYFLAVGAVVTGAIVAPGTTAGAAVGFLMSVNSTSNTSGEKGLIPP